MIHKPRLTFRVSSQYKDYFPFLGLNIPQIRSVHNIISTTATLNVRNSQSQPRRSFLTYSNTYPYHWLLYIRNENSNFQQFSITIQTSILILFIRNHFHPKDRILVAVIKRHSQVDSSIRINILCQLSVQGLFPIPGIKYSSNKKCIQYYQHNSNSKC